MGKRNLFTNLVRPALIILLIVAFFAVYNAYLVDASLETLQMSIERTAEANSPVSAESVNLLLNSALMNELAKPNADLGVLNAIDLISTTTTDLRSAHQLRGSASILKEVVREKEKKRFFLLRWLDRINQELWKFISFVRNSILRLLNPGALKPKPVVEYQLVIAAKNFEREQNLKQAKEAYEKFLRLNEGLPGSGLIGIRLAFVETKLGEFDAAKARLKDISRASTDQTEILVARNLERQIQQMEKLAVKKDELEKDIRTMTKVKDLQTAYFGLGLINNQLFDLKGAQEAFKKVIDLDPVTDLADKARFNLGFAYKLANNIKESEKIFLDLSQKATTASLQTASALQLASIKKLVGDFIGAAQILDEVAQKAGGTLAAAVAQFTAGNVYLFNLNSPEQAEERFKKFQAVMAARGHTKTLTIADSFVLPMREYGFYLFEKGRLKEAREVFTTILKTDKNDAWSYSGLGVILELEGQHAEGYENVKKGYETHPDYYTASALAYIEERKGNLEEATQLNRRAIKLNPNYLYPYYNLGHILLVQNNFEEAVKVLSAGRELSIKLDRKLPLLQNNLGYSLYNLKQHEKALAMFNEALVLNSKLVEVWYNRALVYEALGNQDAYWGDLEQAAKLNSTYKDIQKRLGQKVAA